MKRFSLFLFLVTCLTFILTFSSCKKEENSVEPDSQSVDDWKTSDTKTYQIPKTLNGTVTDNISNFTFRFPGGGSGELKISRITSGPNITSADSVVKIEYAGNTQIQIVFKDNAAFYNSLIGYVKYQNNSVNEPNQYGWMPVPGKSNGGETVYELPKLPLAKKSGTLYNGNMAYKNFKIPKNQTYDQLYTMYDQKIFDVLNRVKNILTSTRKTKFGTDFSKDLPYKLYIAMNKTAYIFNGTKEKYQPYNPFDVGEWIPLRQIVLTDGSNIGNIAHETGHYIHHLLIGDSKFSAFAANSRIADHKIGTTGASNQLIEEPAYFTEYFMNGSVGGNGSPESGRFAVNNGSSTFLSPNTTNMNDVEGMTTAIFASLIRTSETVRDFENKLVPAPVISKEITDRSVFFQEIYEIIAQGTDNIFSARTKLESVLAKYSQQEKMPAMLEPLGWSYHGEGRVVDMNNKEIKGAIVKCLSKVGNVTYISSVSSPTNDKGIFSLPRIFPGNPAYRIIVGKDSLDVSRPTVDWAKATNLSLSLGDFQFVTAKYSGATVSLSAINPTKNFIVLNTGSSVASSGWTNKPPFEAVKQPLIWSGNKFTTDYDYTYTVSSYLSARYTGKISGEIDFVANKIKQLDATVVVNTDNGTSITTQSISLADVPITITDSDIISVTTEGDVKKYVKDFKLTITGTSSTSGNYSWTVNTIDWTNGKLSIYLLK